MRSYYFKKAAQIVTLAAGLIYAANFAKEISHFSNLRTEAEMYSSAGVKQRMDGKLHERTDALSSARYMESLYCINAAFEPWHANDKVGVVIDDAQTYVDNRVSPQYHKIVGYPHCSGPKCKKPVVIEPHQKFVAGKKEMFINGLKLSESAD